MSDRGDLWLLWGLGGVAALTLVAGEYRKTPAALQLDGGDVFDKAGSDQGIDSNLLRAIAKVESNFDSNAVRTEANGTKSIGLMQVLDKTAIALGVDPAKLYDPLTNVVTAARLLNALKKELGAVYNLDTWIAAYNAGSPRIIKYGIINPGYVQKVEFYYRMYQLGGLIS